MRERERELEKELFPFLPSFSSDIPGGRRRPAGGGRGVSSAAADGSFGRGAVLPLPISGAAGDGRLCLREHELPLATCVRSYLYGKPTLLIEQLKQLTIAQRCCKLILLLDLLEN